MPADWAQGVTCAQKERERRWWLHVVTDHAFTIAHNYADQSSARRTLDRKLWESAAPAMGSSHSGHEEEAIAAGSKARGRICVLCPCLN